MSGSIFYDTDLTGVSNNGDVFRLGGTGENFPYQRIVGPGFPVKAAPGLELTVGEAFCRRGTWPGPCGCHQRSCAISLSVWRMHPTPAAAWTYLVFFDWDRATLSPRAREIIAEAAQNTAHVASTRIEVDGYADTSHASSNQRGHACNLALSHRRADSVRAELVRDGATA